MKKPENQSINHSKWWRIVNLLHNTDALFANMLVSKQHRRTVYESLFKGVSYLKGPRARRPQMSQGRDLNLSNKF